LLEEPLFTATTSTWEGAQNYDFGKTGNQTVIENSGSWKRSQVLIFNMHLFCTDLVSLIADNMSKM
jgi:hypothetical protein